MKLTEIQIKIIAQHKQLVENKKQELQQAEIGLTAALFCVAGKEFKSYEIKENELIIKDEE